MNTKLVSREEVGCFRKDIAEKLSKCEFDEVVVPYSQVARAFPSDTSDTRRFNAKYIDQDELSAWSLALLWSVDIANDISDSDGYHPVKFVRLITV